MPVGPSRALVDSSAIIEYLKGNKNAREAVDRYDEAYISILIVYGEGREGEHYEIPVDLQHRDDN